MARTLTPLDAHAIMNALVAQATGQTSITSTDTSSFVAAGELVLATGMENTLNALSLVLGRTLMAVRPYGAKLGMINALNTGAYSHRLRKISFYSREALPAGDWNTNLYNNLVTGYDNGSNGATGSTPPTNSTESMWVQNKPVPLEVNFAGSSVWQDSTTVYEYQVKQAFRDEQSFNAFVAGILTEKGNDIESQKEAFNRMTLLNYIAGVYDLDAASSAGRVVNLTKEFNTYYNIATPYTTSELLTTYLKEFLEFFVSEYKKYSDLMTYRSASFHHAPAGPNGEVLLRHTPKDKQRFICYNPFWLKARAMVMPEIFAPQYLAEPQFEAVDFWQSFEDGPAINVTPAIPDFDSSSATAGTQIAGDPVDLDYVLGILYDEDAIMTDFQLESSATTPLEARKRYRNIWWSFAKNSINDFTENAIIFTMEDESGGDGGDGGDGG